MSPTTESEPRVRLAYNGYNKTLSTEPDRFLCSVGRDTPGGQWHRRFWQPVAYERELGEVPLAVRALGEDLVAFRDKSGAVGVLHRRCCHRNTSLEFGVIEDHGIRCCYHGRLFDVDGTILDMPGEPAAERLRAHLSQGSYPVHLFGGIVFVYMGPPEELPIFPVLDRFDVPGLRIVAGERVNFACNWLQNKENAADPHHTNILHVIPNRRGMAHFADAFENFPVLTWAETPGGQMYLAARRVKDNIWVRSSELQGSTGHMINSIFETGDERKDASRPFLTFWTLPIDDEHTVQFFVSHVADDEPMPFDRRRELEMFGQNDERPYAERQWIPGDNDAIVSQGRISVHANETLGWIDRGVAMYRRYVRRGIETVNQGERPAGVYFRQEDVPSTYANDLVVSIDELDGNPDDPGVLARFIETLPARYTARPPMQLLKNHVSSQRTAW